MKKLLKFCGAVFLILLALSVAASVIDEDSPGRTATTQNPSSTATATASPEAPFAMGDTHKLGNFNYTVHGFHTAKELGDEELWGASAGDGATFVIVDFTIENTSDKTQIVLTDDFELLDSQGRTFTASSDATTALLTEDGQDFLLSELQPGLPARTKTAFKVPVSAVENDLTLIIPKKGWSSKELKILLK